MEDFNRLKIEQEEAEKIEPEQKWFKSPRKKPKAKDQIVIKLIDCELGATHAFIYVRDSKNLGLSFNEWRYASEDEKEEFGRKDCIYLKENKEGQK